MMKKLLYAAILFGTIFAPVSCTPRTAGALRVAAGHF